MLLVLTNDDRVDFRSPIAATPSATRNAKARLIDL